MTEKQKKKIFSSFDEKKAFKQLKITKLSRWDIEAQPVQASEFFHQRLARLTSRFNLKYSEKAKELLIDAICEEGLEGFNNLIFWKGAALESDELTGNVDYLLTENKDYLEAPFLCVVEAKKDDFEKGLAQCMVEMQACQWNNQQLGKNIDIFGIVTNGEGWKFYKLTVAGRVYETLLYSISNLSAILGILHDLFQQCESAIIPQEE